MLKKLGSVIMIIFIGCFIWLIFNIEDICKKYIYPQQYSAYVETAAAETGVDKYLIYAVIKTESGFDETAVSEVGARGLMQLTEDAFEWVKFRMEDERDISYDDMFNARYNIEYGSYLLKLLYEEYDDAATAIAAYHSGRGNVNEWLKSPEYSSDGKTLDNMPQGKTKHYVKKVMTAYKGYNNLYG